MPYYLDEVFSPVLAALLRANGIDAASALERAPSGTADEVHLLLAGSEGRCLVTKDFGDFSELTLRFMELDYPHAGVLLVPRSLPGEGFAALVNFGRSYPHGLAPMRSCGSTAPPRNSPG